LYVGIKGLQQHRSLQYKPYMTKVLGAVSHEIRDCPLGSNRLLFEDSSLHHSLRLKRFLKNIGIKIVFWRYPTEDAVFRPRVMRKS